MVFLVLLPLILLITAAWLMFKLPKWRRRRELDRGGAPYCSHCLHDLSDVDLSRTEFCPQCRRRLPRFAMRRESA